VMSQSFIPPASEHISITMRNFTTSLASRHLDNLSKSNSREKKYEVDKRVEHSSYTAKELCASDHLTHVDSEGNARMVNVNDKSDTIRRAKASGKIDLGQKAFELVAKNQIKKGDVLTVGQLAGIMGAKQTSNLIPLCHPLLLNKINVKLSLDKSPGSYAVEAQADVECCGKTGVEMEALTAVSVSLLAVYDMCKAVTKDMQITEVKLISKTGGKSDYQVTEEKEDTSTR